MRNKYGARKTTCRQNHLHDSKKEAGRCDILTLMQKGNEIDQLEQQPEFLLLPRFTFEGKVQRPVKYIADFRYYDRKLRKTVVEDCKGMRTDVYRIKKKLLLATLANRKNTTFIET